MWADTVTAGIVIVGAHILYARRANSGSSQWHSPSRDSTGAGSSPDESEESDVCEHQEVSERQVGRRSQEPSRTRIRPPAQAEYGLQGLLPHRLRVSRE